jgi:hypothetical protein
MIDHAVFFAPLGFPAGTGGIVAFLRAYDAGITLGQALEAGVAVTLIEALTGFAVTVNAIDDSQVIQLQRAPQVLVEGNFLLAQQHGVLYRIGQFGLHLAYGALGQLFSHANLLFQPLQWFLLRVIAAVTGLVTFVNETHSLPFFQV